MVEGLVNDGPSLEEPKKNGRGLVKQVPKVNCQGVPEYIPGSAGPMKGHEEGSGRGGGWTCPRRDQKARITGLIALSAPADRACLNKDYSGRDAEHFQGVYGSG